MLNNIQTNSNPICTIDPYKFLKIRKNPNGLITRLQHAPSTPPCSNPNSSFQVLSKDVPLNLNNGTLLRLFLPKLALNPTFSSKLQIIVYFHGGGFIFHHASSTMFHNFCSNLASFTLSLVVSVDYRLAPEHRLPAAYDDGLEALMWIRACCNDEKCCQDDQEWLTKYGDFSNCFIMGSSAGGTLAYKLGTHVTSMVSDISPLIIKGWILHYPAFGGSNRTRSETNLPDDPYVPLSVIDLFSENCLPIGADPGHDYLNFRAGVEHGILDRVRECGLRILVTGGSADPFVDRQIELVKLLGENGVIVRSHFNPGDSHAVEIFNTIKCDRFLILVKDFISSCMFYTKSDRNLSRFKANL